MERVQEKIVERPKYSKWFRKRVREIGIRIIFSTYRGLSYLELKKVTKLSENRPLHS